MAAIGTGWWLTTARIPTLLHHPQADLVAIADIRPEVLEKPMVHSAYLLVLSDLPVKLRCGESRPAQD